MRRPQPEGLPSNCCRLDRCATAARAHGLATFVAAGFEHSIANMYFVPLALFLDVPGTGVALGWDGFVRNLVPVTLGNLVGGAGLVGAVYWIVYRRPVLS